MCLCVCPQTKLFNGVKLRSLCKNQKREALIAILITKSKNASANFLATWVTLLLSLFDSHYKQHRKVTHICALHIEKIAKLVLLCVLKVAFPASLFAKLRGREGIFLFNFKKRGSTLTLFVLSLLILNSVEWRILI